MTLDEALNVLSQVAANFQGTLAQHQQIQTALQVVQGELAQDAKAAQVVPEPEEVKDPS